MNPEEPKSGRAGAEVDVAPKQVGRQTRLGGVSVEECSLL